MRLRWQQRLAAYARSVRQNRPLHSDRPYWTERAMSVSMTTGRRFALTLTAMASFGCGGAGSSTDSRNVRDSAGVEIVVNEFESWKSGDEWQVSPEPLVDIGAGEGQPEAQLFRVRDVVRWHNSIVVLNGGTDDLRVFDLTGKFQTTIGRRGGGPGEFQNLGFLAALDEDSILTWDSGNDRLSVFDRSGRFVRSFSLERADEFGAFLSPSVLLQGRRLLTTSGRHMLELDTESDRFVDSVVVAIHDLTGALQGVVGLLPGGERMRYQRDGIITTLRAPFERSLSIISLRTGYCWGFSSTFAISCHSTTGQLMSAIRFAGPAQPITDGDVQAYIDAQLQTRNSNYRRSFRRVMEDITFPQTYPAFAAVKADEDENLWIQETAEPGVNVLRWRVFTPDGVWLGSVTMPTRFRLHRIYADAVLGVWQDSLDVEHVRLYELVKTSG